MKNILTRGGIEFLAVLLGISGSLWLEDNKEIKQTNYQINRSLNALNESLNSDKKSLEIYILEHEEKVRHFDFIQNSDSVKFSSNDRLKLAFEQTTTPSWINRSIDRTIFNAMESSGLIYKINDDSLRNSILKVFQNSYSTLIEISDYDLHTIQEMDKIVLSDFVMSKNSVMWNLNYNHSSTRNNIVNNQIFQNYLAANKSTKSILFNACNNVLNDVNYLLDKIDKELSISL